MRYDDGMEWEDIEMEVELLFGTLKGFWFHELSLLNQYSSIFSTIYQIKDLFCVLQSLRLLVVPF